jgi:Fe2+ transport system protein B
MEIERRNKWIGIIIGACFVPIGTWIDYSIQDSINYTVILIIVGGFIAGMLSSGNLKDGIKSGFLSGLIGSVLFAIPFIVMLFIRLQQGTAGEMEGMIFLVGPMIAILAVLFASAGGMIGAICKKALFGEGKEGRQQPDKPSG